ncbi:transposase [Haloterrigena sp. SYSU A558-1]|uniref:Transposase n=1 Tax=Haloterrigena gelatinilytica TaxID=2741724 RepID=A0ABX2LFL2_9EURY|nr:transposase [Haloterrigena gelatinilytica]NUC75037.1 transposase [Haloterrigena gelatinilytica]
MSTLIDSVDVDSCKFSYTETQVDGTETRHVHTTDDYAEPSDPIGVANQVTTQLEDGETLLDAVRQTQLYQEFDDPYWNDHPKVYDFQTMLRTFLYAELRGFAHRSHISEFLDDNTNTALDLGFEFEDGTLEVRTPHQTVVNECWNDRFNGDVQEYITETVSHVHAWALENRKLLEASELEVPNEDDEDDDLSKDEIRRIMNELMRHICPNLSFDRDETSIHSDNIFFEVLAHCAFSGSSVYGGGETFEWMKISDDAPPSGRTFHDHIKDLSLGEQIEMFDNVVESQIETARDMGLYEKAVPLAIDTTTVKSDAFGKRVTFKSIADPEDSDWSKSKRRETYAAIEKWGLECLVGEDPEDIRNADFDDQEKREAAKSIPAVVRYVRGTKSGDEFLYAWEFAAACIAHPVCPQFIGMKPLGGKAEFENHVREFVERAQELVPISDVYMDAAYAQVPVFQSFHYGNQFRTNDTMNMPYVMNITENDRVEDAALKENPGGGKFVTRMDENDDDITIINEFRQYSQEHGYGTTSLVALPKRGVDEVEDPITDRVAFCTNRTDFDAANARTLLQGPDPSMCESEAAKRQARLDRGYGNRWVIENGFQKVKDFLAFTKSGHPGVRLFYMLYASIMFNCWMLVDRTIKERKGIKYESEPQLKAKVFAVIVANYLRPIG